MSHSIVCTTQPVSGRLARLLFRHLGLFSVALQLLACSSAPPSDVIQRIDNAVAAWPTLDGAQVYELGDDLAQAVAVAPEDFFFAMAAAPAVYDSWLLELPRHTLTVFAPDQVAAQHRLVARIRAQAHRYASDDRYGAMARRLEAALSGATLQVID